MNMSEQSDNDYAIRSNEETYVTEVTNNEIKILACDMRFFNLQTFFHLWKAQSPSLTYAHAARSLLRKAIQNYYKTFGLFKKSRSRVFILNPIFIYEIIISNIYVADIVSLMRKLLSIMGFRPMDPTEETNLEHTYFKVSNSLESGTLERDYSYWLRTLYEHKDNSSAFFAPPPLEVQGFMTYGLDDDSSELMLELTTTLQDKLPSGDERQEFMSLMSSMVSTIGEGCDRLDTGARKLTAIQNAFERATNVVANTNSLIKSGFSEYKDSKDKLTTFGDTATDVLLCSIVGWCSYKYSNQPSKLNLFLTAGATALAFYYGKSEHIKTFLIASGSMVILKFATENWGSSDNTENSSGNAPTVERQGASILDMDSMFTAITDFLTSIKWTHLPRRILELIRMCNELPKFILQVYKLIKGLINSAWAYVFKVPLFSNSGDLNPSYSEDLAEIYGKYQNDNLEHTFYEAKMTDSLIDQTRMYLNKKVEFGDRRILDSNLKVLLKIKDELTDMRYSFNGTRQEPCTIMFQGLPETSKTLWSRYLANTLVKKLKPNMEDYDSQVYVKPEGEYWSQYKNQIVTCFDDFGQVRDSIGDPREKSMLINMYNTAPFPLNMNNNEDKGKHYFSSSFVIMTGNGGWDLAPSLISEQALKRRIDFLVEIQIAGDKATPINDSGIKAITPENYQFIVSYRNKGDAEKKVCSYYELVDLCMAQYKVKEKHYSLFRKVQENINSKVPEKGTREELMEKQLKEAEDFIEKSFQNNNSDKKLEQQMGETREEETDANKEVLIMESLKSLKRLQDQKQFTAREFVPKIKIMLSAKHSGEKQFNDYKYHCEYFDDVDELTYQEVKQNMFKKFPFLLNSKDYKRYITDIDRQFLELHYGERRTALFIIDINLAVYIFSDLNHDIVRNCVSHIANESRGYYYTTGSVLMSIWTDDRFQLYDCFEDSTEALLQVHNYKSFNDKILLSDWKLAVVRNTRLAREGISTLLDKSKSIVENLENALAERVYATLGVKTMSKDDIKYWMRVSSGLIATLTVAWPVTILMFKALSGEDSTDVQSSQTFFKEGSTTKKIGSVRDRIKQARVEKQANGVLSTVDKIENNAVTFSVVIDGEKKVLGKALYLTTNSVLMPLHFMEDVIAFKDSEFLVEDNAGSVSFTGMEILNIVKFEESKDLELAIITSDKFKKPRTNIIDRFVSKDAVGKFTGQFQIACRLHTENTTIVSAASISSVTYGDVVYPKTIKYYIDTGKGDCGSIIYALNPALGKSLICGIHQFGHPKGTVNKTGYAFILTKEDIINIMADQEEVVEVQGANTKALYNHSPYGTSKIVKSEIGHCPELGTEQAPAKLLPYGGKDPLVIGLAKYKLYPTNIDEITYSRAYSSLLNTITSYEHYVTYGDIVDFKICFYGDEMNPYARSVPTKTSCGYPWKYTSKDMKCAMKEEGPNGPAFQKLLKHLHNLESDLESGIRPTFIYTTNLKDETRPIEKVNNFSTRVFFGTPIDLFLLTKKYFGEFMLFMMQDCVTKGTAMSINPHSTDWRNIFLHLTSFTPTPEESICQDFDYAHFDGSNNPTILKSISAIINTWYTHHGMGQSNGIREILFKEVYNFKYVVHSNVEEMNNSLPSGSFLTLLVNCLTNKFLLHYAFLKNFPDKSYALNVKDIVQGDDNVVSINPLIKDQFSPTQVAEAVSELGFEITLGNKQQVTSQWSNIFGVTFLKRKFARDNFSVIRAPIDEASVYNTLRWSKKGILYHEILCSNIEYAYREFSQMGESEYLKHTTILRSILSRFPKYNVHPQGKHDPWMVWDRKVRNEVFFAPEL